MSVKTKIDFVSDVACPWCAVGLGALEQAIERLGDEIKVDGLRVEADGELITVEIVYTRRRDLAQQAVRLHFQ